MNRSHYIFAIIFLTLGIGASLFQGHLYFQVDNQLFIQNAFINWFLVTNVVGLAGSVFLLKYFHFKKYGFAFKTGTVCYRLACFVNQLCITQFLWQESYKRFTFLLHT